jgi:hypothetical protein
MVRSKEIDDFDTPTYRWPLRHELGVTAMIKTLSAPFRAVMRFPLVQFAFVVMVILLMQSADDGSIVGTAFAALDKLVDETLRWVSSLFVVKTFTKSWLTFGFMIAYVYVACWIILSLCAALLRRLIDFAGRQNFLWSRNPIARARGVAAYRAWLPLERIRPEHISQRAWEEQSAWPPNDEPPYLPLGQRILRGAAAYTVAVFAILVAVQLFSPFPVLRWIAAAVGFRTG